MSVTDEIKARLDIVQVVQSYGVTLKRAGRNYMANCPFHQERTPSFVVFPDRQGWHCFGACGEGGDIFNFVMKREGLDFVSALRVLAERAGVQLQDRSEEQIHQDEALDKLRGLLDEAARYFHKLLIEGRTEGAKKALAYTRKRGLSEETLVNFRIGYAPDSWQEMLDHLRLLGYDVETIIEAGMAIRNEDTGRIYDRFRDRLMIPIGDERGRPVGFGARALKPEDNPKYLNSPQTALFDKSNTLFGLNLARRAIRETETAVIVEGYMDAIQAHQSGFANVVAQMGTALTKPQLKQLGRYARRLVLALDPDVAGAKATMRGLDVVRQASESGQLFFDPGAIIRQSSRLDLDIQVVTLPEGKDPDDLIREAPEAWRDLIAQAKPVSDYVIAVGTANLTPQSTLAEREQVARELLPILLATENDLQRNFNIQQLAYKLRLGSGKTLVEWAQQINRAPRVTAEDSKSQAGNIATTQPGADQKTATSATPGNKTIRPPGVAVERFVLAALLRDPLLLSGMNRKLREIARGSVRGQEALGGLSTEDFTLVEHRAIFDTLLRAVEQFDQDVLSYISERIPYEMHRLLEELLAEQLEVFEQRLTTSLRAQFVAIRQVKPVISEGERLREALELHVLELRKLRLRRQNTELQIMQQGADDQTDRGYGQRLAVNSAAILALDNAARHRS